MRHKKSGRKLNRNSAHRKALFKNLAIALIEQDIIKTTLPKAKELRSFIEPRPGDKADMAYIELVDRQTESGESVEEPELKEKDSAA